MAKIDAAGKFNQGFKTVEYLSSALIDMKLHLAGSQKIDADKFERETLATMNMPSEIVMRHRTPQFNHVFSGDGYSAGYYSYLWSDTITADAWEAFTEAGGPWDKDVAKRLRDNIFARGQHDRPDDRVPAVPRSRPGHCSADAQARFSSATAGRRRQVSACSRG